MRLLLSKVTRADPEDSITFKRGVRAHIAFFNWSEQGRYIGGELSYLGINPMTPIADFWTGETIQLDSNLLQILLPPHTARLFEIS